MQPDCGQYELYQYVKCGATSNYVEERFRFAVCIADHTVLRHSSSMAEQLDPRGQFAIGMILADP
jgi:hypothetical protein